jgi:translocation and assembly module TamA
MLFFKAAYMAYNTHIKWPLASSVNLWYYRNMNFDGFNIDRLWRHILASLCLAWCLAWCLTAQAENNITFTISGVSGAIKQNIEQRLDVFDQHENRALSAAAIEHLTFQGVDEIKTAIMPYGYFNPKITSQIQALSQDHWVAHYSIIKGPHLAIKKSTVTLQGAGHEDPAFQRFLAEKAPRSGQYFSSIVYEDTKNQLLNYAFEHGYLDAKLQQHKITIDRQQNNCVIMLTLDTGLLYDFGPITFHGSHLNHSMLARYPTFSQGEAYNEKGLRTLQSDLMGSGYFDGVNITNRKQDANNNQIPIAVKLTPGAPKHYQLGIGYGTDTGVRGLASLQMNQLNAYGHKLAFNLRASRPQQYIEAKYTIPGHRPASQHYMLGTTFKREDDDKGESTMYGLGASHSQIWRSLHIISALNYQLSTSNLRNEAAHHEKLLIPSLNLSLTRSDRPVKPISGYHIDVLTQGTSDRLGSTITFFQSIAHAKRLQPLSKHGHQSLMLRAAVGYTASHEQEVIPLDYQFYTGGSQSIRGYGYHKFGPGPDKVEGSVEFRQHLHDDLYATTFVDAGNTGNSIHMKLHKSVGIGLLYRTIVGSFHLSLAKPIATKHHFAIEFSMGPEL